MNKSTPEMVLADDKTADDAVQHFRDQGPSGLASLLQLKDKLQSADNSSLKGITASNSSSSLPSPRDLVRSHPSKRKTSHETRITFVELHEATATGTLSKSLFVANANRNLSQELLRRFRQLLTPQVLPEVSKLRQPQAIAITCSMNSTEAI